MSQKADFQASQSERKAPISDSPWFWVLLFAMGGLFALLAVSGKYGKRQAGIEQKFQARQRLMHGEELPDVTADQPEQQFSEPGSRLIPLWPLAVVLVAVAAFAAVMLLRHSRPTIPDD